MKLWNKNVISFFQSLAISTILPRGVSVMNPYENQETLKHCKVFYKRFYNDDKPRFMIMGINPGRWGAGLTGIPFTDPIRLESCCGIKNGLWKKPELSSDFIYQVISAFGGVREFYQNFYFSSVCPLGFTKDGKNLNYYDIPDFQQSLEPFILNSIRKQLKFRVLKKVAFCLGDGKNYSYLSRLNEREQIFDQLIPLAHPRYIMQYKRKELKKFIDHYVRSLKNLT